jgi:hypothetical protein
VTFWKSDSSNEGLERRLRRARPEPSEQLVASIEGRLRPVRAHRGSRMAFAAAFATFVLGAIVSAGGVSYAATATSHSIHTVKVIVTHHAVVVHHSSAHSQYDTAKPVPKPTAKPPAKSTKPKTTPKTTGGVAGAVTGTKTPSSLPFTGLSLLSTAVLGLSLLTLGLFLRRREARA